MKTVILLLMFLASFSFMGTPDFQSSYTPNCNGTDCSQKRNDAYTDSTSHGVSNRVARIYSQGVYDGCISAGGCPGGCKPIDGGLKAD